ncbi:ribosome-associated translation inhibitor RaiA [Candidatus Uhrbacteria bacterium]|nr:ribosome-associated translation inhibitor RaiA [Candidatus Uhrbacteria bacterium]
MNIKSLNIELTPSIAEYVQKRLEPILKMLEGHESLELDAEVGKETKHHNKGPYFRATFHLHLGANHFQAEEEHEDLYAAIDGARDELRRQIVDFKERLADRRKKAQRPDKM